MSDELKAKMNEETEKFTAGYLADAEGAAVGVIEEGGE
jgi:hypothetical protein